MTDIDNITCADAALVLENAMQQGRLPERDLDFVDSLVGRYRSQGFMSEKQVYWMKRKALQFLGRDARPESIDIHGAALVAFMDRAHEAGLKYPKIKLSCNGEPLVIARAGTGSRNFDNHGTLTVTDGGSFGDNVFYGRVLRDGTFKHSRECTDDVTRVLRALATDPTGTAAAYGQRTGNCCFCRRDLEDYRSVSVGYGPICAEKYGLPWGEVQGNPSEYREESTA